MEGSRSKEETVACIDPQKRHLLATSLTKLVGLLPFLVVDAFGICLSLFLHIVIIVGHQSTFPNTYPSLFPYFSLISGQKIKAPFNTLSFVPYFPVFFPFVFFLNKFRITEPRNRIKQRD